MEVLVKVSAENRWSGKDGANLRCYSYFTMLGVDSSSRKPQPLPPVAPTTPDEAAYYELADQRKHHRQQVRGVVGHASTVH